jgi:hypothetical protein
MAMSVADITGHHAVIQMLLCSLEPREYLENYKQFKTIRKLCLACLNVWGASSRGTCFNISNGMEDKHKQRLTQCLTDSEWSARINLNLGCKKQMGQDVHPQLGLSIEVMLEYMKRLDSKFGG